MRPLAIFRSPKINYQQVPFLEKEEKRRLEHMFKKWSDPNNSTKISRFLKESFDPRKVYTKKEISDLWSSFSSQNIFFLTRWKMGKSNGYGKILVKQNNYFFLHPTLIDCFEKYF